MGFLIGIIGLFISAALVVVTAFIYVDILDTKHEVKQQLEKMDRLRKQIEKERKEKE